jgi:hypothetical protein
MDSMFVVGRSTFRIQQGPSSADHMMRVTITRDGRLEWTYHHASWRPLAVGCGSGSAYVWTARDIVVLPDNPEGDPHVLHADEDLLFVFKTENKWLLVCETSVRLIVGQQERSRLDFGEVIERAHWAEGRLFLEDANGVTSQVTVTDDRLIL